jgi:hypothetical protein
MAPDDIRLYHERMGYKTGDTIKFLKGTQLHHGYEESYDHSLYVFYFTDFLVIIGTAGLIIKQMGGDV